MSREILFTAKNKKGKWIFGMPTYDLSFLFSEESISSYDNYTIIPETLFQYTGIEDVNDVKIFENDIIEANFSNGESYIFRGIVVYDAGGYCLKCIKSNKESDIGTLVAFSIGTGETKLRKGYKIGNIFDNPELLEQ